MWGVSPILQSWFVGKLAPPTDSQPPSREGGFFYPVAQTALMLKRMARNVF
jgi:hypothetical protein